MISDNFKKKIKPGLDRFNNEIGSYLLKSFSSHSATFKKIFIKQYVSENI